MYDRFSLQPSPREVSGVTPSGLLQSRDHRRLPVSPLTTITSHPHLQVHGRVRLEAGGVEVALPRVYFVRGEVVVQAASVNGGRHPGFGAGGGDGEGELPCPQFVQRVDHSLVHGLVGSRSSNMSSSSSDGGRWW